MRLRYTGPPGLTNEAVGRENPDKGPVLQTQHIYEVTGDAAQELLKTDDWKKEAAPSRASDDTPKTDAKE